MALPLLGAIPQVARVGLQAAKMVARIGMQVLKTGVGMMMKMGGAILRTAANGFQTGMGNQPVMAQGPPVQRQQQAKKISFDHLHMENRQGQHASRAEQTLQRPTLEQELEMFHRRQVSRKSRQGMRA